MKIYLVEPFFSGSHRRWAEELQAHSKHEIKLLTLPGRHWKWRMYGGAVHLAEQFNALKGELPDLILATDMLDLTTFAALTRHRTAGIPMAVYFHENQITYPWSPTDADVKTQRNNQYGFLNYTSALAADRVFFNSQYHLDSFTGALPGFLRQFPDKRSLQTIETIREKSQVLHLGMGLRKFDTDTVSVRNQAPVLLWNHRWEYDKNPRVFFESLFQLQEEGLDFKLIVTGENYKSAPSVFAEAKEKLQHKIIHFGYAESFGEYARLLQQADILPVTSNQDFFGGSVVEAIYCNCLPLLPKRLAYPEHIPQELQENFFYENEADFLPRLRQLLSSYTDKKDNLSGRIFTERYDWKNCIKRYDEAFEAMNFRKG